MKKIHGFTLIELVIFIIITGLLASTIMLALSTAAIRTPQVQPLTIALQTARFCMEYIIGQRYLNGFNSIPCPNTTTPGACAAPAGYSVGVNFACTTLNTDTDYKTITVTVSGLGSASLTTLIANY